jgi:hypothetical protein
LGGAVAAVDEFAKIVAEEEKDEVVVEVVVGKCWAVRAGVFSTKLGVRLALGVNALWLSTMLLLP